MICALVGSLARNCVALNWRRRLSDRINTQVIAGDNVYVMGFEFVRRVFMFPCAAYALLSLKVLSLIALKCAI